MTRRTVVNDRYELDELPLARGGMGEVWTGRDIKLEREVVVKFVRFPEGLPDQQLVRRFVRESRITARLEHPGVPAIFDVGTHDQLPYMVMQRIHGVSVADIVAEQAPLPVGWAAAVAAQVCSVLSVAHTRSLVHRDLKPSNLMLDADGAIKVLDFGLAVALRVADHSQITRTGQVFGTPSYMAPEQIMASMSEPRTDLYALGCTLHTMLSGEPPFNGPTPYAIMRQQVDQRPSPLRRGMPSELERLVLALLEKRPDDRPASAEDVYYQLLPFVADLGSLPGAFRSATSAVRMYASVLSRVSAGTPETAPAPSAPPQESSRFSRGELDRARDKASELVRESRYSQAAEVLAAVVEPASRALGRMDDDVISIRRHLADLLYEGGDYHRAASQFQQLARDLAARHGSDDEQVLHVRLQEATCHALTGETGAALAQLDQLLHDQRRVLGDDDQRTLELRRQIGLLQLGAGQRQDAKETLMSLLHDLTRAHGPDHAVVADVRNLLTGIESTGGRR